ncbi:MAG: hypothetical protein QOE51_4444 [Actinoplanes sp.]|nr:hypothetical protein [Actinoplanes sp.]
MITRGANFHDPTWSRSGDHSHAEIDGRIIGVELVPGRLGLLPVRMGIAKRTAYWVAGWLLSQRMRLRDPA